MNKIILNKEEYKVTEQDLPYLVIYGEQSGGSYFTVSLITELFRSGSKILFFTTFPMAKDNFLEQVGPNNTKISFVNSIEELESHKDSDAIILNNGDENLFIEVLKTLGDLNERVVLVKNIEAFTADVFTACLSLEKIILSGHIDMCTSKENIMKKSFKNIVVFTKPEIPLPIEIPELEKWTGYLSSESQNGMIKVQIS